MPRRHERLTGLAAILAALVAGCASPLTSGGAKLEIEAQTPDREFGNIPYATWSDYEPP
jgi:hypothetical protein